MVGVFVFALRIGRRERARLKSAPAFIDAEDAGEPLPPAAAPIEIVQRRAAPACGCSTRC